jgi:hypothetical protein
MATPELAAKMKEEGEGGRERGGKNLGGRRRGKEFEKEKPRWMEVEEEERRVRMRGGGEIRAENGCND